MPLNTGCLQPALFAGIENRLRLKKTDAFDHRLAKNPQITLPFRASAKLAQPLYSSSAEDEVRPAAGRWVRY